MGNSQKQHDKASKKAFLEVLRNNDGHISKACKSFNIDRGTYYVWMKEEWFAEMEQQIREEDIDNAETMARILRNGIPQYKMDENGNMVLDESQNPIQIGWNAKPDGKMIRHYLDTQGKKRGYGKAQDINLNIHKMPEDVKIGLKIHKKKGKK